MNEQLHLFGLVQETNKLRVTSPVQSLRPEGVAVTLSGRVYRLIGTPGDPNQVRIWAEFRHSDWTDVTKDVEERLNLVE